MTDITERVIQTQLLVKDITATLSTSSNKFFSHFLFLPLLPLLLLLLLLLKREKQRNS